VIKDHHRFLTFYNTGAIPVKITNILIDGGMTGGACHDFFDIL